MSTTTTRFAPSPSGLLHCGHAYAALVAHRAAGQGGRVLLRMEDIDQGRCKPIFEQAIIEDLAWLGIPWEGTIRRQSERMGTYRDALGLLQDQGLLYPCFCTRKEILAEAENSGYAPHVTGSSVGRLEGPRYPGTCRHLSARVRQERMERGEAFALRLDMQKALRHSNSKAQPLTWHDGVRGEQVARPELFGDVVLARKDMPTSYHLAVVVDDAATGVTLVTRGEDLFLVTHIHRLLQALLGIPCPAYYHHPLLRTADGKRLAKRDQSETLCALRERGVTVDAMIAQLPDIVIPATR